MRRGTPALATWAQPTSLPILAKLGFQQVAAISQFVDDRRGGAAVGS